MSSVFQDKSLIQSWREKFGFDLISWVPLPQPLSFAFYANWLQEQRHGDMTYLETQSFLKQDPRRVFPQGQSLLVVGVRYKPHPVPLEPFPQNLKIASYARGQDYHVWLTEKLQLLCDDIRSSEPAFEALVATDSKPFLERDLAAQAGLGWVGKNTCLIHPQEGSFFFIAEILTNLLLPSESKIEPLPDFCGTCQRCMVACPTGAIEAPRLLDARKCISYWTIEAKEVVPEQLRDKIGTHFFGCDICQDVCPWNEKVFRQKPLPSEIPRTSPTQELRFFLTASNREMQRTWGHTPLIRARPRGLRRNAMIVAANGGWTELIPEISRWQQDQELGELARWALTKLNQAPASS